MAEKKKQSLAEFIVSAPLYTNVALAETPSTGERRIRLPRTITRYCSSEKCRAELGWDHQAPGGDPEYARENTIQGELYTCRNCAAVFHVWFFWRKVNDEVVSMKIGQLPQLEVPLPRDLEKALGDHVEFWKKGMRSRHHGYGIGALAYFRRIIEGTTGKLLELLADAMEAGGEPASDVEAVRELITAKAPFDTKMEQAAKMIPRALRPGGANPFQTMFDILSGGLHADTDEECCALVDALAQSILLIVAQLNQHIERRKAFDEAVRDVERLRAKKEST